MEKSNLQPVTFFENYDGNGELKSIIQYVDKNIKEKMCLVPKWALALSFLGSLFILIFLSASLYMFFSPRSALYQENCEKRSCVKNFNLKCINKTCLCENNYLYIDKCIMKKNYFEQCHMTSMCKEGKNMTCLDGVCKCNQQSYWNGSVCRTKSTINQPCTNHSQCLTSHALYCDKNTNKCACDNYGRFWDQTSCFPKRTINERCNSNSECRIWENSICSNGKCKLKKHSKQGWYSSARVAIEYVFVTRVLEHSPENYSSIRVTRIVISKIK